MFKTIFVWLAATLRPLALPELFPATLLRPVAFALAVIFCCAPFVYAQDAAPAAATAVDPTSWLYVTWTIVQPLVTLLVTLFGPVIIGIVAAYLVKLLRITDANQQAALEGQLRAAVHQSALNAVKFALGKLGLPASAALTATVISTAMAYVQDKNAGDLAKLGVSEDKLKDILTAKAQDVASAPSWVASELLPMTTSADEVSPAIK